jgi:membrane protein DedA with SNARE-associated domain
MELLNDIYAWLSALPPAAVYAVLFGIAYFENVVPPIPGDVAIVVAGMIAATAAVSLPAVVVLATIAGGLGFMSVYAAGRYFDEALNDPTRLRWLPRDDIRRAEEKVARYGLFIVAANRFLPGLRAVIAVTVGMSHLRPWPVAVLSTASAAVWAALVSYLGYALVDKREVLARLLGGFERVGLVMSVLLAAALVVWIVRARRRRVSARREGQETAKTPEG